MRMYAPVQCKCRVPALVTIMAATSSATHTLASVVKVSITEAQVLVNLLIDPFPDVMGAILFARSRASNTLISHISIYFSRPYRNLAWG